MSVSLLLAPSSLRITFPFLLLYVPIVLFPNALSVQASEVQIEITATTSSRLEEPAEDAANFISVVTEPEIQVQNPETAPEILRDLPGVRMEESGTIGESAKLTIRGTEPSQTLIMLDGIRLNSPFRGDFDLGNLTAVEFGQIELVRGGNSALYGSEAIGGVVNLKSKQGRGPLRVSLTTGAGGFETFREGLSVSGGNPGIDASMSLFRTDSDGQFDRDRYGGTTFTGQVGFKVRDSGRLQLTSRFQKDHKELATDIPITPPPVVNVVRDENSEVDRGFYFNSLGYEDRVSPWLELSWKAAVIESTLNWDNPLDPAPAIQHFYFENTDTRTIVVDLQQNLLTGNSNTLSFGFEGQWDSVESEIDALVIPFPAEVDESRKNSAYYLQNLFKWDERFVLQAGVRRDFNSSFETVTNPRVSTTYRVKATGTRIKGSWGKGFRAPPIQNLFDPFVGNNRLKAERSRNWEAGLQQELFNRSALLEAAFFRIDYDDLIQRDSTRLVFVNIGEARTRGVESGIKIEALPSLAIKANYTYLDARDLVLNEALPFRARNQANLNFLYTPLVNLMFNLDINMVSSQALSEDYILEDGTVVENRNPGYTRVDLSARFNIFRPLPGLRETQFFLRVRNLFDKAYQEVPGFPAPGLHVFLGLEAFLR